MQDIIGVFDSDDAVVSRASKQAQVSVVGTGYDSGNSAPPPQITTGVADDGSTTHPFIWGLDQYGNPNALYTKKNP